MIIIWKIIIIEDTPTIARELEKQLKSWGFTPYCVKDFTNFWDEFEACAPHLVLMDIFLPAHNGYYWCGKIREQSNATIGGFFKQCLFDWVLSTALPVSVGAYSCLNYKSLQVLVYPFFKRPRV